MDQIKELTRRSLLLAAAIAILEACSHRPSRKAIPFLYGENPVLKKFSYNSTVEIVYAESGAGRPLLLLHGFGASKETWLDVKPALEKQYTLIMPDLKGFGESSKPKDQQYGIPEQAEIISAFITALNLRNLTLIGHSYGGSVALLTYLHLKEQAKHSRIKSLVIIDAPVYPQRFPSFIAMLRAPVLNRAVQDLIPATLRAGYTLKRVFYDRSRVTSERIQRYARYFDISGMHDSMICAAKQIVPEDPQILSAHLTEFDVPTLLVWGDKDQVIPLWQAYRMASKIPGARIALIPNCGHVPHEEKPREFLEALSAFLE